MTGLLRGTLTIATVAMFGSKWLPGWIDAFNILHPDVHIRVRSIKSEDIEVGLVSGAYDLGFSLGPPEHNEIESRELVAGRMVLLASPNHPIANKKKLQISDLNGLQFAIPTQNISSARAIGAFFAACNITPHIVIEQDDGHALVELIKLGKLVTILPTMGIKDDPGIVTLPLPEPGVPTNVSAMWTQLKPAVSAFLEVAVAKAAESFPSVGKAGKTDSKGSAEE
jgi:DNA-binding transcriptional LysR family regulator